MQAKAMGASRTAAVSTPTADARAQTLDRIADLLSRLPESRYFGTINGLEVNPAALLTALDTAHKIVVYRDDGKAVPKGWVYKATRQTDADQVVARMSENFWYKHSDGELRQFERSLRAHLLSNGLLPR